MQAKRIIVASGLSIAIMSTTAIAQTRGTDQDRRQNDRQTDRQNQLGAQGRDGDRSSASDNLLTSLEGVWTVKIEVNRTQWQGLNRTRDGQGNDGRQGDSDAQRLRDQRRNQERTGQPDQNDRNPQQRDNQRDGQQRDGRDMDQDTWNERVEADSKNMHKADGIASSQTILGGDILRTTVILGADTASTRTNPGQQQRDGSTTTTTSPTTTSQSGDWGNDQLRTMSFLGKNEQSGKYDLVFMTAQGGMHTFSGDYDASAKRIVFRSKDSASGMQDRTTTPARGADGQGADRQNNPRGNNQPGDRQDTERQGTERDRTSTTMGSDGGMAIVLEMKDDNTYTVTAYRSSTSVDSLRGERGADWGGQPALTEGYGNQEGDDARQSPNIVYKATYTKADEGMRSQYERMIEEQEGQQRNRGAQNPSRR